MSDVAGIGSVSCLRKRDTGDWWDSLTDEARDRLSYSDTLEKNISHHAKIIREGSPERCQLRDLAVRAPPTFAEETKRLIAFLDSGLPTRARLTTAVQEASNGQFNPGDEMLLAEWSYLIAHWPELKQACQKAVQYVVDQFAPLAVTDTAIPLLTVPVHEILPNAKLVVDSLYRLCTDPPFYHHYKDKRSDFESVFLPIDPLRMVLVENHQVFCARRGLNPERTAPARIDATAQELVEGYFRNTPLLDFFKVQVPIVIPREKRFSHTHIMGRTDAGKTTLMERLIHDDLHALDRPGIVVMTPHRDLIRSLASLAPPLSDRMVLIDPSDEQYPPAINPFSSQRRLKPSHIIKTFDYILASLGLELTAKQMTLWKYAIRVLINMPKAQGRNATVMDIQQFMLTPDAYKAEIDLLDPGGKAFVYQNILAERSNFKESREQIGYRLANVLFDDAIRNVLSSQNTKVDFFEELNRGSVILIDTAKSALADASTLFGGMMLSLIFQAMLARDDMEGTRRPVFVYVDECANYMTDDLSEMLTELRKFRCGLTLAHHDLSQPGKRSPELRASILSQPAVKFAHPSDADASAMAGEMKTTAEFLRSLPAHTFALYVNGAIRSAVQIKVQPLRLPKMTKAEQHEFVQRNRERVSSTDSEPPPSNVVPLRPETPADDGEWI